MNRANLRFSLFNGDLKSGSERCDDALYHQSKARFNRFTSPVVVVPGDNDWTDCHRENNGSYDPLERLAYERKVFYSTPYSFGRVALRVQRQPGYPENALFCWSPVTYVGLNVHGSNNNLPHAGVGGEDRPAAEIAQMHAEYNAREAANERWLTQAFDRAKARNDKAVLIWWQADPNFNNEMKLTDPREYNGFTAITAALRKQVLHFSGQVVLVHGDSHYFRIDKPLMDDDGRVVSNFTRVETFGEADTDWVSATVSPEDPNVFTFRPQIVPG